MASRWKHAVRDPIDDCVEVAVRHDRITVHGSTRLLLNARFERSSALVRTSPHAVLDDPQQSHDFTFAPIECVRLGKTIATAMC